jgi:hypothetical protein
MTASFFCIDITSFSKTASFLYINVASVPMTASFLRNNALIGTEAT